eukprot:830323-Rhodomonas_salina.1
MHIAAWRVQRVAESSEKGLIWQHVHVVELGEPTLGRPFKEYVPEEAVIGKVSQPPPRNRAKSRTLVYHAWSQSGTNAGVSRCVPL